VVEENCTGLFELVEDIWSIILTKIYLVFCGISCTLFSAAALVTVCARSVLYSELLLFLCVFLRSIYLISVGLSTSYSKQKGLHAYVFMLLFIASCNNSESYSSSNSLFLSHREFAHNLSCVAYSTCSVDRVSLRTKMNY